MKKGRIKIKYYLSVSDLLYKEVPNSKFASRYSSTIGWTNTPFSIESYLKSKVIHKITEKKAKLLFPNAFFAVNDDE